jgi:hypothetical protein
VTSEGFEHNFALYYLSRHIFAWELQEVLGAAERPLILGTTVPGMKAIRPMLDLIENRPEAPLNAYIRGKRVELDNATSEEAERLHQETARLLDKTVKRT